MKVIAREMNLKRIRLCAMMSTMYCVRLMNHKPVPPKQIIHYILILKKKELGRTTIFKAVYLSEVKRVYIKMVSVINTENYCTTSQGKEII